MWEFLCNQNLNLFLLGIGALTATVVLTVLLWRPIDLIRDRLDRRQPDMTVTETGVGEIIPDAIIKNREAWEGLLNVFEFGGFDYE